MEWGQVQKEISKIFSVSLSKIVLFDTIYEEKNLVYCFRCDSMKFVIKINLFEYNNQMFIKEYKRCQCLSSFAFIPKVIFFGEMEGHLYFIMEYVQGKTLESIGYKNNFGVVIAALNLVNAIDGSVLDSVDSRFASIHNGLDFSVWCLNYLKNNLDQIDCDSLMSAKKIIENEVANLAGNLDINLDIFEKVRPVLLHTDMHARNLLVENGNISIIDWYHAEKGDNALEIASILHNYSIPPYLHHDLIKGYRHWGFFEEFNVRLKFYDRFLKVNNLVGRMNFIQKTNCVDKFDVLQINQSLLIL